MRFWFISVSNLRPDEVSKYLISMGRVWSEVNLRLKLFEEFSKRYENINWTQYYKSLPFNSRALSLYNWSPIADELKTLDKKIVLNSMILKWDNVKKEFIDIINI